MHARTGLALAVMSALFLTGCSQGAPSSANNSPASSETSSESAVKVVRVIDGDTIDVKKPGESDNTRVRLLNVDTPETKHPNKIIECLGPEATKHLEDLLPAGTPVTLENDVETHDKYSRELAGVYKDGSLVNADIAREGLGTAILIEPNKKFYPEVLEAQNEAEQAHKGLFDPAAECSIPAQAQQLNQSLNQAPASQLGQPVEEAAQFVNDLDELSADHPHLKALLKVAVVEKAVSGLRENLKEKRGEYEAAKAAEEEKSQNAAENDSSANVPAAPAAPPAQTENNQDAQQAPAAPAVPEAPRQPQVSQQQPQQRAPQPPPAPEVPQAPPAPAPAPAEPNPAPTLQRQQQAPAPAPAPEPKYTGCRSYAPGGKSWTPIPCN